MTRHPPKSTLTAPPFPDTTLFRSSVPARHKDRIAVFQISRSRRDDARAGGQAGHDRIVGLEPDQPQADEPGPAVRADGEDAPLPARSGDEGFGGDGRQRRLRGGGGGRETDGGGGAALPMAAPRQQNGKTAGRDRGGPAVWKKE